MICKSKILLIPIFCLIGIFIFGNFVLAAASGDIIINEIAAFELSGYEWIEIYNTTGSEVDLTDWKFIEQFSETDENGVSHKLSSFQGDLILKPNEYAIIAQDAKKFLEKYEASSNITVIDSSWGSLKEKGERIALKDADGNIIEDFIYLSCLNYSLERINPKLNDYTEINWQETEINTPGEQNSIYLISKKDDDSNEDLEDKKESQGDVSSYSESTNHSPIADAGDDLETFIGEEIEFDASDSYDFDGDELIFSWDFGDGIQGSGVEASHVYLESGKYIVTLKVSDGNFEDVDTLTVTVRKLDYSDDIIINEFLPNPEGKDSAPSPNGEWIELFNQSEDDVDLGGWQIDDLRDGGSRPYTISQNTFIKKGEYLVFYYEETKITLNNKGDEVCLIKPSGDLSDIVSYKEKALEGKSFCRIESSSWVWCLNPTPGKENIIVVESENKGYIGKNNRNQEGYFSEKSDVLSESTFRELFENQEKGKSKENPVEVSIGEAKDLFKGVWVRVKGIVLVPPKVLGKKIFYISDNESGIQIYSYKGEFPDLEAGDRISLIGKISKQGEEKKINLENKDDIVLIEYYTSPEPRRVLIKDIDNSFMGTLVSIEGEVVKTSGNVFWLADETGEIKIYIRSSTGIKKPKMERGDCVSIVGIVSKTSSGYRILPRLQNDIKIGKVAGVADLPSTGANLAIVCLVMFFVMGCGVYLYGHQLRSLKQKMKLGIFLRVF